MEEIAKNVYNVGVEDKKIDFFEGQYVVPDGVTYNSYVIVDDKIAVLDTVDGNFCTEWLSNIEKLLNGKKPDYLIVQHMEPDHSACIKAFAEKYPSAEIVGNKKTFVMMGEYFGESFTNGKVEVEEGQTLGLGYHTLQFVFAPMVHWPEVMLTYETTENILFSADAFGKFGVSRSGDWADEARRYFIGIVGKYGLQVQSVLKKASALNIKTIAPLHGYPLKGEGIAYAVNLYDIWSSYKPEKKGVAIACASVYGHTKAAADKLKSELESAGIEVKFLDLVRDDWAECVAQAFAYEKLVIASVTYNAEIFPAAREFIARLIERGYKNRTVAFIENGSWAPVTAKLMKAKLEGCKNLTFAQNTVTVRANADEKTFASVTALAQELVNG